MRRGRSRGGAGSVSAPRRRTTSLFDRLDRFPVGLVVAHRVERHRLQDRVLETLLVDGMYVEAFLSELVGELGFALLDVGGGTGGRLERHFREDLLVGVRKLAPHVRGDL